MNRSFIYFAIIALMAACNSGNQQQETPAEPTTDTPDVVIDNPLIRNGETNFADLRQLTYGGDNAEAYWSFDDRHLVFQATYSGWDTECDQIYVTDWANDDLKANRPNMVSTGKGRTTCSYFLPGDSTVVYASTHEADEACPPVPPRRKDKKYVWPIYEGFDILRDQPGR